MRHLYYFIACAFLCAATITAVAATKPATKPAAKAGDNPLLTESTLPYHVPPFDKLKNEHFGPAIEAGMREQLKEVDTIAKNSAKPTFENTIVALERTGQLLRSEERR